MALTVVTGNNVASVYHQLYQDLPQARSSLSIKCLEKWGPTLVNSFADNYISIHVLQGLTLRVFLHSPHPVMHPFLEDAAQHPPKFR